MGNLHNAGGSTYPASEVLDGKDVICVYFSARQCPPCRAFTKLLKKLYEEVDGVEVIFVSSDHSPEDMETFMQESHGDWWALEHGSMEGTQTYSINHVTSVATWFP